MTLTADADGILRGRFTIPANVPAGAKTVAFRGAEKGGSRASAIFVGQGDLTVQNVRQVNTVTNYWADPLAQSFVLDADRQVCGVDLWFTAAGGDARVQIRDIANGFPGKQVLAEAFVSKKDMVVTGGGHSRVLFPAPASLAANTEYALVVLCDDAITELAVAELGKFDSIRQTWITSQPYQVGVLFSSSNGSTWTAHQDKDLTFRLLGADFTPGMRSVDLGNATLTCATDLVLLALEETPTSKTRVEYELTMPSGEVRNVASGQVLRFNQAVSGGVGVKARLSGEAEASPLLWPGTQVLEGEVQTAADYYTRSIGAATASKAVLIYDAIIPSGASVTPQLRIDGGEWQAMIAGGTVQQGDGVVEYRFTVPLSAANEIKARLNLTGSSSARPRVRNIRLMALI